jgi:uncharacterized protein YifN (PemK superfamily)
MNNLHQDHFEDFILTGDFRALNVITKDFHLSTKMDGSPAVVFGKNPATGKFFVSTKSAFNKVKIKLCHSHEEIDTHFKGEVADILHDCFDYLPRTSSIFQCDFLGFGNSDIVKPNTISYLFPEVITQKIIVSVHTQWATEGELKDAYVVGPAPQFESDDDVYFVDNSAYQTIDCEDFVDVIGFIKQMATTVTFATEKEVKEIKKQINACIWEDRDIVPEEFDNPSLISLWKVAESIKLDFLHFCRSTNAPKSYLYGEEINHEGFVLQNDEVIVKFVNRRIFSHANFLNNNKK